LSALVVNAVISFKTSSSKVCDTHFFCSIIEIFSSKVAGCWSANLSSKRSSILEA
jgi:hypothetical protein